ncbi:MAG: SDR family NAD(P)-dependent oxidoreductase [Ruminococcaceae bacterium]|nr:SDR family NAD(P)-dependent oxidoreductase [Oscillospiraceae bacterium]
MSNNLTFDLTGKVAVVTGGGGVLCSGFSKTLAKAGAAVAVCDLRAEAAQKVADEIVAEGGRAIGVEMNVLQKESVEAAKDKIYAEFGKVDILLNGAGGNNPKGSTTRDNLTPEEVAELDANGTIEGVKTFFDLDPEGISFVFNLNFLGTLIPTQVFARDMARCGGNIINVSSMNAFRPLTRIPAYSGAKAAVSNFTQWLAVHFAPVGIRVNAIAPGFFLTEQNRTLLTNPDGSLTARADKIITHTPMKRFGTPDDLDGTLLWLADDRFSAFVDGVVIPVDGGFAAYSGV